jgi:hypothetical protein
MVEWIERYDNNGDEASSSFNDYLSSPERGENYSAVCKDLSTKQS